MPATQTIEFPYVGGQSVASVKLFPAGSDTQTASVAATEEPNRKGTYLAAFTDAPAGTYRFIAFVGSTAVYTDMIDLTLTTATFRGYLEQTADTSILATIDTNVDMILTTGSTGPWTSGSGSDATLSKQNEILTELSQVAVTVATVCPISSKVEKRVSANELVAFVGETKTFTIFPIDDNDAAIDFTAIPIEVIIEKRTGVDAQVIADAQIIKTPNSYQFTTSTANATKGKTAWAMRTVANEEVFGYGDYNVKYAARKG